MRTQVTKNRVKQLVDVAKSLNATRIVVSYDGSGDSGQIESAYLLDKNDKSIAIPGGLKVNVRVCYSNWDNVSNTWVEECKYMDVPLENALKSLCEDHLSEQGIDWYNNDGGYGEQVIDVETGKVTLKHNQRITDSEYHEHEI